MFSAALEAAARATRREQLLERAKLGYASAMPELPDKLGAISAAAAVFDGASVLYALIGGLAVGIRSGVPRATLDVDFAVTTSTDRDRLSDLLVEAGFSRTGVFPHSINFQHASGEPVQLAFDPVFDAMIARAEVLMIGALALRVVTTEDLIAMKRMAAADPARRRSKALRDQADIALLEGDVPEPNEGW
jgi:Nucleotidyl transferase AbiEii toxin, Type IV TA system